MKNLGIFEINTRINELATEIENVDLIFLRTKLNQFLEFLKDQPITNRILQCIEEDNKDLSNLLSYGITQPSEREKRLILASISSPEKQGAFGYYLIIGAYQAQRQGTDDNLYINLSDMWYDCKTNYVDWQKVFNTNIFKPFIRLINWYISDHQSSNQLDYFSKSEIIEMEEKLVMANEKLQNLGYGQEILFDEIQELKELLMNLKKKNWTEILKAKFSDLILNKIISVDTAKIIFKIITDNHEHLLDGMGIGK